MKSRLFRFVLLTALSALITACGNIITAAPSQDPDIASLVRLSGLSTQRAQSVAAGATLRQVDIDSGSGRHIFRFTDAAATREITVVVPTAQTPSEQWEVTSLTVSPLVGRAAVAIDLGALRVGPGAVAQAMQQYRTDARVRTLTLVDAGGQLVWYAFGEVAEGDISGQVSNATRTFQPLGPGPIQRPPTALPGSR